MLGKKPFTPAPEDQVELKPILGIRPGVYIAIVCLVVILLGLFLLLFYPGITRPGAMVVFSSEPVGAALRVDGVYLGTSPCKVFVPQGKHIIETVLPGFESQGIEYTIPGRLFASMLFPRRFPLEVRLTTAEPMAVLSTAVYDYAAWTFGGEPTATWQIPLSLSEGVYRIGNAAASSEADGIIAVAARYAVTGAALRDLLRAKFLASSGGITASPLGLAQSVSDIVAFLDNNPGSAAWLADILPSDSAAILVNSPWYQNQLASFAHITAGESLVPMPGEMSNQANDLPTGQIRVGGLLFTGIGGGKLVQGEPFPFQVPVESFLICTTEIPIPAYADFLDANPQWHPERRDSLQNQGLVSSEYLADYDGVTPMGNRVFTGISMVSWFAANAFCEWLTEKLPSSYAGWEIRLPTEAEWEFAAKSTQRWGRNIFIVNGGAWEWCSNPYSPLPFFAAPQEAVKAIGSPEYPVRGGSWLNSGLVSLETRASLPPASCSSFVSFRPVIARSGGGLYP
jgi:hypothetical protein